MIQISREPHDFDDAWMPTESCAFCGRGTRFWNIEADVAVCPTCADSHDEGDLPTKEGWIAGVRLRKE